MKPVKYHPEARTETIESTLFYDSRQTGLGDRFLSAVKDAEFFVQSNPEAGSPSEEQTRMHRIKKFPFALVYREYSDHIFVIAVAHLSRRPRYWLERA
ncbi:MAG: type II toxin-antitoxin system RelE/ParE family toxin [Planctomycetota bacterium]|nr:type II toxin-antitoxin system RelE/ParE family toxin [Planctomycetota bacterium]MDA1142946.1 type II toxin-antitoxin system RelE/ParE family toxin [Planctomycetota bacterium]